MNEKRIKNYKNAIVSVRTISKVCADSVKIVTIYQNYNINTIIKLLARMKLRT